jgi:hypothetical protein
LDFPSFFKYGIVPANDRCEIASHLLSACGAIERRELP